MYPSNRLRRLRQTPHLRELFSETVLSQYDFIYPVFVEEEVDEDVPIRTLPGVSRIAESRLARHVEELYEEGIRAIILFGVSHHKDHEGRDSWNSDGLLARMIRTAKSTVPELTVISDNCFCEYTSHGHCGIVENGTVHNDKTLQNLAKQAVVCAEAGADIIAPSAMMDGQVTAIRSALDRSNFQQKPIMSYSTKFASHYFGPFREAASSTFSGDRKSYQMDFRNRREALLESLQDVEEGADILMVKPAGTALDIIADIRKAALQPLAAYQVSGEYAAIKFAAQAGALDETGAMLESITAIKRAGADLIISYFARDVIKLLR